MLEAQCNFRAPLTRLLVRRSRPSGRPSHSVAVIDEEEPRSELAIPRRSCCRCRRLAVAAMVRQRARERAQDGAAPTVSLLDTASRDKKRAHCEKLQDWLGSRLLSACRCHLSGAALTETRVCCGSGSPLAAADPSLEPPASDALGCRPPLAPAWQLGATLASRSAIGDEQRCR